MFLNAAQPKQARSDNIQKSRARADFKKCKKACDSRWNHRAWLAKLIKPEEAHLSEAETKPELCKNKYKNIAGRSSPLRKQMVEMKICLGRKNAETKQDKSGNTKHRELG